MSRLIIQGARPLKGRVRVSGAKNSVLPIIAASLLADGRSVIEEVPYLNDVKIMCNLSIHWEHLQNSRMTGPGSKSATVRC